MSKAPSKTLDFDGNGMLEMDYLGAHLMHFGEMYGANCPRARYTHRVAISNNRLPSFSDDRVTFLWKDYQHGAAKKTMTLAADEFIRRFLLHVLRQGFSTTGRNGRAR